jgi:hypothetical protein
MSSQTQFQLPMIVEHISPFSMSSALPLLKAGSSKDVRTAAEPALPSANPSQSDISYTGLDGPDYQLGSGRGHPIGSDDPHPLPTIPELSWSSRLSAAERTDAASQARAHVSYPDSHDEYVNFSCPTLSRQSLISDSRETSFGHPNIPPVLITGPGSNSSTHSGMTSDSAPRTPSIEARGDYFAAAHSHAQPEDYLSQPDGYAHEAYPAAPHSYLSSPSTLYLRDSWGQFVLDAQSHYVSAAGSAHGAELRSNKPPSTIEERGEKWTGEVRFRLD